jgi:hypothetical protein
MQDDLDSIVNHAGVCSKMYEVCKLLRYYLCLFGSGMVRGNCWVWGDNSDLHKG